MSATTAPNDAGWLLDEAPEILRLEDALATPIVPRIAERRYSGCLYDRDGHIVRSSQRHTGTDFLPIDPPEPPVSGVVERVPGESVYLGQLPNHYGHFLLETLSRFWAAEHVPEPRHWLFHRFVLGNPPHFPPFVKVALDAFAIAPDRIRIIDSPLQPAVLHVPTPLYRINRGARPEFRLSCARVAAYCRSRLSQQKAAKAAGIGHGAGRYFLSRAGIPLTSRAISNEREVERIFESLGFEIMRPEKVDYAAQVVLYSQATVLAGFTGSALHNVLFSPPHTTVIDIADARPSQHQSVNQQICDWVSEARVHYVPFRGTRTSQPGKPSTGDVDVAHVREAVGRLLGG